MANLEDLEKKINSELTTKIKKTEIKHNQIYIEIDKEDLIDVTLFIKTNKDTKFRQLIDITVVDYPQNNQRFERRQNPVQREKNSLFGSILSSLPNFFGGLVFLSVLGLILGSAYIAFNALLPVFEEIWAFLEFLWEVGVSIVDFLVAVANFIGSVFEFIISIFEFIYEILEFIIWFFIAIIALLVWLIVGILSYAGELFAWIF